MAGGTCGRGLGPGPGPRERVEPRVREAAEARRARGEVPPPAGSGGAAAAVPRSPAPLKTRAPSSAPTVSLPPELRSLLASGRARLIDVRSREEAAAGTIPGALNIPVSELESALQMEPAAFQALFSAEKPKLEDENLIFFCQIGKRGLQATQLAQGLGYTGARNYAGAYREWFQKEGLGSRRFTDCLPPLARHGP